MWEEGVGDVILRRQGELVRRRGELEAALLS
jgi:hypothetical protein